MYVNILEPGPKLRFADPRPQLMVNDFENPTAVVMETMDGRRAV